MARNEQRHLGAPGAERALDAVRPHRRMQRGADIAKKVRAAAPRIEGGGGLPVYPGDIVLLAGEQKRLAKRFVPGPQDLPGDPGVGKLADGKDAGGLVAKQHLV